ncbi:hypothetical protein [Cysteiniphilum litorale]|uniref:hypothetical protein n=1 Tax=Cysteiniphilum litorale TaxID=2056700 RepID=UPI003F8845A1
MNPIQTQSNLTITQRQGIDNLEQPDVLPKESMSKTLSLEERLNPLPNDDVDPNMDKTSTFELNKIWVGDKNIPQAHLDNIVSVSKQHLNDDSKLRHVVWMSREPTNNEKSVFNCQTPKVEVFNVNSLKSRINTFFGYPEDIDPKSGTAYFKDGSNTSNQEKEWMLLRLMLHIAEQELKVGKAAFSSNIYKEIIAFLGGSLDNKYKIQNVEVLSMVADMGAAFEGNKVQIKNALSALIENKLPIAIDKCKSTVAYIAVKGNCLWYSKGDSVDIFTLGGYLSDNYEQTNTNISKLFTYIDPELKINDDSERVCFPQRSPEILKNLSYRNICNIIADNILEREQLISNLYQKFGSKKLSIENARTNHMSDSSLSSYRSIYEKCSQIGDNLYKGNCCFLNDLCQCSLGLNGKHPFRQMSWISAQPEKTLDDLLLFKKTASESRDLQHVPLILV